MNIVGVTPAHHDISACLVQDGKITAFVEEERLSRIKKSGGPRVNNPIRSIEEILEISELDITDIDRIGLSRNPTEAEKARVQIAKRYFRSDLPLIEKIYKTTFEPIRRTYKTSEELSEQVSIDFATHLEEDVSNIPEITPLNHHLTHAASAYYFSPFERAIVVSLDERGDAYSTTVYTGTKDDLSREKAFALHNSLGRFYGMITEFLGYMRLFGEGKIMGLAPYGKENKHVRDILHSYCEFGDGKYDMTELTLRTYEDGQEKLASDLGFEGRDRDGEFTQDHKDLAYHTQKLLEDIVSDLVEYYVEKHNNTNVCLAGGVALNCKMNKRIRELDCVKNMFVQPVAGDAGGAIGAAGVISKKAGETITELKDIYTGTEYTNKEIEQVLDRLKIKAKKKENRKCSHIAEKIQNGNLVGWFNGRMEGGPRALGNRSILADPRSVSSLNRVNKYVKHREEWRPFAPSMLPSEVKKYLIGEQSLAAKFMIDTYETTDVAEEEIPAVLHPADQTARPQIVTKDTNPDFYNLLSEFRDRTGVGVLLNTSFNDSGEPIVRSPREAIRDFYASGLDVLVMNDWVLEKP